MWNYLNIYIYIYVGLFECDSFVVLGITFVQLLGLLFSLIFKFNSNGPPLGWAAS